MSLQKWLAFAFGVVFIIGMLGIAFLAPRPTEFQIFVFRVVLALAAAGIGATIPGFIDVNISKVVRAGGAMGLLVLIYWFNPARLAVDLPREKQHEGFVGALRNHLNKSTAEEFTLTLAGSRQDELNQFWIDSVAGKTWAEVFGKICNAHAACLRCDPPPGQIEKAVTLELFGAVSKGKRPEGAVMYSCK